MDELCSALQGHDSTTDAWYDFITLKSHAWAWNSNQCLRGWIVICRYLSVCLRQGNSLASQVLLWHFHSEEEQQAPTFIAELALKAADAAAYNCCGMQLIQSG